MQRHLHISLLASVVSRKGEAKEWEWEEEAEWEEQ